MAIYPRQLHDLRRTLCLVHVHVRRTSAVGRTRGTPASLARAHEALPVPHSGVVEVERHPGRRLCLRCVPRARVVTGAQRNV